MTRDSVSGRMRCPAFVLDKRVLAQRRRMEKQTTARFFRKVPRASGLREDTPIIKPSPFQIVREILLPDAQYRYFQDHLLEDAPFIAAHTELTSYDQRTGCSRCLLITSRQRRDGILVNSEGYKCARYAAYVKDKAVLDLQGVVRDNLDVKAAERRPGRTDSR